MAGGPTAPPDGARRQPSATLFVSDPTAEAEAVTRALRGDGYNVVDVPLSMLVARVAVQPPNIVVVDADSHGAFEVVARVRELPHGDDIPVLFIAARGGAIASPEEALAHEGSGLFVRPIDLAALLHEVEALTRNTRSRDPASATTIPPAAVPTVPNRPSVPRRSSDVASPGVDDMRTPFWPSRRAHADSFSSEPPTSPSWIPPPRSVHVPPVSADLQRLLAEAEQRVQVASDEVWMSGASSPEQEVEAMLPAELLAALDEPIDEDERDFDALPGHSPSGALLPRERTHDGGGQRTTGSSETGGGATPNAAHATHATPMTGSGTGQEPLTPPPHAGGSLRTADGPDDREHDLSSAAPNDALLAWVGPWNAMRVVARSVAARASGSLCIVSAGIERRVILREGDIVTCASAAEDESLLSFLSVRGELPRETVRRLGARFPPFGRHAGAALVARGYLRQDQMWPTLRAHAEWLLGRILQLAESRAFMEAQPPGRLAGEPSVFGGGTGAGAFVEVVRRVVAPAEAVDRLGGGRSRLGHGAAAWALLGECGLTDTENALVEDASGRTLREVLESTADGDFATVVLALTELGVTEVLQAVGAEETRSAEGTGAASSLDAEAIRERVRARLQLVEDGDYFAVLGVPRDATGYEVRRAFLELRRTFEPSRLLSPELADLSNDVQDITTVLEEAYEILKDGPRRERYRRAIEGVPGA